MLKSCRLIIAATLAIATVSAFAPPTSAKEVTLRAVTGLPIKFFNMTHFAKYRDAVNAAGKGSVQIKYLGGPETTPGRKQPQALSRGVFDIVYGPGAWIEGIVPEVQAILATNLTAPEVRASGGLALIDEVYRNKVNAHILAVTGFGIKFTLMLGTEPKRTADGGISLAGLKVRGQGPTYRALIQGLGGTMVTIQPKNIFSAIQRGMIDGVGWPDVDYKRMGWFKHIRYRIEPTFLHAANYLIINVDKWNSLSGDVKSLLTRLAIAFEKNAYAISVARSAQDRKDALRAGVKVVTLSGEGLKKYRSLTNDTLWSRLAKQRPKTIQMFREKLYKAN